MSLLREVLIGVILLAVTLPIQEILKVGENENFNKILTFEHT